MRLAERIPGTRGDIFTASEALAREEEERQYLPTGLASLDRLLEGGFPRGSLIELSGPVSSGRTSLSLKALAEVTRRGEQAAYIDAFDCLDPAQAQTCGVRLQRLLWVRCGAGDPAQALRKAFKAADILARAGGFGVVVLDLESLSESRSALPSNRWFRLQRAVKGTPTTVLVLHHRPGTASASSLSISMHRTHSQWDGLPEEDGGKSVLSDFLEEPAPENQDRQTPLLLGGVRSDIEVLKGRGHDRIAVYSRF